MSITCDRVVGSPLKSNSLYWYSCAAPNTASSHHSQNISRAKECLNGAYLQSSRWPMAASKTADKASRFCYVFIKWSYCSGTFVCTYLNIYMVHASVHESTWKHMSVHERTLQRDLFLSLSFRFCLGQSLYTSQLIKPVTRAAEHERNTRHAQANVATRSLQCCLPQANVASRNLHCSRRKHGTPG